MHSDAPGQDGVGGVEVKQDANWIVPESRSAREREAERGAERERDRERD